MNDTANFNLPMDRIGSFDINHILLKIPDLMTTIHKIDDTVTHQGHIGGNYKIVLNEKGVRLYGSLPKYYNSHNFDSLNITDTKRAIEKLSDELLLPVTKSKVSRLDIIPQNIITTYKPQNYYPYFTTSKYFQKIGHQKSIEYRNHKKSKILYDKTAQAKSKRENIPTHWTNKNILRYELRLMNRLPTHFNMLEVKASDLYSEKFRILCLNKWYEEFNSINTLNTISNNMENIKTTSDVMEYLALEGLSSIGYENALKFIDFLKEKKTMSNKEAYSRAKAKIKQLANSKNITEQSELITELKSKVDEIKKKLPSLPFET
ncbi:phage/plasmid replication domain-containing protein [Algoriphagus persicinus]|uniref:phage/plasmid replication domain-containing protein n=1 Tax=Algoriphagus persicinus TaxID=3108754 RepID=UPI002B382708|nr:phage/plasmid replication protein [Algoriphagus sp. E1-3-M2]MEB2787336.1 phage/plasmid replication protein [Algoriphagus sp. E1-3-M2]